MRMLRVVSVAIVVAAALSAALPALAPAALTVGQKAPDFSLPPAPGAKEVKLSELTAKGPVVLYTFIQAFTAT